LTLNGGRRYRAVYGIALSSGKEVVYWKSSWRKWDGNSRKRRKSVSVFVRREKTVFVSGEVT
jgi:hypothetical protein